MSEEEIVKILKNYTENKKDTMKETLVEAIQGLLDLYNKEKEKYKRLSIEAQATAFDDQNKDTEGLLRVLLKQGEITLDEKGYYQREDFDWEENLYKLGLMKKKEKGFYIPDDECLDEYTKQLENQLKEYNEIKETFRKYCVMDNDTLYDGCYKMQDEIDELKEKNKELEESRKNGTLSDGFHTYNDLYYQRCILFATICNMNKEICWKSKKHSDGKKCFDSDDWFIVGIDTPEGCYTYHYEIKYWNLFKVQELQKGKEWDGHTEKDVIRLFSLVDNFISKDKIKAKIEELEKEKLKYTGYKGLEFSRTGLINAQKLVLQELSEERK